MIIMIQIDNIILYNDYIKTKDNMDNRDIYNDKYMRLLMNQMTYIIKQNNDMKKIYEINNNKFRQHKSLTSKSFNDLCKI